MRYTGLMPYDVYDSIPPRISTWLIDDYTELAEVLRVVQADKEHRYWFNRTYPEPYNKEEPLPVELLQMNLDPDDPELFFEIRQADGTTYRVSVATGSCCVTTSSNGSAYISAYRLYSWALPSFLFHPELRPIL